MQFSTAVRNGMLSAWVTDIGVSAILRLFGGTMPANCATAVSANNSGGNPLLAEFDLASTWMGAPSSGTAVADNLPLQTTGASVAAGGTNATFYRIYASDGVTCHEQGTVTLTGSGGDLTLDNVSISSGQNVEITTFSRTAPGA